MSHTQEKHKADSKELEAIIDAAIKKISGRKENDLCRYLPIGSGGYIHHFTMRKMRHEDPKQLGEMIKKHIINSTKPSTVPPKQRAARGSKKRRDQYLFTKEDIDRMLHMAGLAGDKDMIRKLTPRKDLRQIKRELIASIRHGRIEQELWISYVEVISAHNGVLFAEPVR